MAYYIAEFPVDPATHATEFVELIASVASELEGDNIRALENVAVSVVHQGAGNVLAIVTYRSHELDMDWHTTALVTRDDNGARVRVEMLPVDQRSNLYQPSKPAIIDILLDSLGSAGEPPFLHRRAAVEISSKYVAHVERLLAGTANTQLPVLFTTKDFLAERALQEDMLVDRLYGLAVVFIESDKHVSKKLKKRLTANQTLPPLWPACLIWPGNDSSYRQRCRMRCNGAAPTIHSPEMHLSCH